MFRGAARMHVSGVPRLGERYQDGRGCNTSTRDQWAQTAWLSQKCVRFSTSGHLRQLASLLAWTGRAPYRDVMSNVPLPAHLQQFAHPVGAAVWAAIMTLDAGLQHEILERLDLHLGEALLDPNKPGRKQRAIRALRRAAELLGRSPSVKAYRRLRDETHDPELIPDASIRSALGVGGWNEGLELAGLAPSVEQVRLGVVVSKSPMRYTDAECLAALRGCGEDLDCVPSGTMYRRWVTRPDVRRRPGRRPMTDTPFIRLFGSFLVALAAAGLTSETVQAYTSCDMSVRTAAYAYAEDDYASALREVRDRIGSVPRSNKYMRAREEIIAESFAAGAPRTIPSYGAILKRYGSWNGGLIAAGLEPFESRFSLGVVQPLTGTACRWTDDELVAIVREACDRSRGRETSLEEYIVWRRDEFKRSKAMRKPRKLPSRTTLSSRLGGWTRAMLRAYPAV